MTLLAAFQTLLHRYTGQPDIAVGSPIAGRTRPEVEGLIGFFVNTLVLRADMRGNPRFSDVLTQLRHRAVAAYANQDLPFERLVDALELERDLSRTPLFQVMFLLQTDALQSLRLPDLAVRQVDTPFETAKFDLTLSVAEVEHGLNGSFEYNTDLFDGSTIDRVCAHFETLLEAVVADPQCRISDLPLLSEEAEHQLLVGWNDTDVVLPESPLIHRRFEAQAVAVPDAIAAIFEDRQLTYRELNARANQLARCLRTSGVGPDVLVGIFMERSLEMVVGMLAVLKAGGAYVPLDPGYPADRLRFMLDDSRAAVVLTEERLCPQLPETPAVVLSVDAEWPSLSQFGNQNASTDVSLGSLAYVIYTSGSTGRPKGAMLNHGAIANHMNWMCRDFPLGPGDAVLQKTPISFDASVWEFYAPLLAGARLVLARPGGQQDAAYLNDAIGRYGVTTLQVVPSLLRILLDQPDFDRGGCLKRLFCGGEALTPDLRERFIASVDAELHNLYGPTETCIESIAWRCDLDNSRPTVPIGRPIDNSRVYLLDDAGRPTPIGVPGEVHIAGLGVGRGYVNRPDQTAERYIPLPLAGQSGARIYRTGDLARYQPDGTIEYLGRRDHQIKIRGYRIELSEIESVLGQHEDVQQAVVLAREDSPGAKRLVAYLTIGRESMPSIHDLRDHLRASLPDYMVPAVFVTLDQFPLTPNGKVDRRALPAPDQSRPELEEEFVQARTPEERCLAVIWCQVLGLERVGVHDNFFELGGDSILSIQIVSRANQKGLRLSARQLFEFQTIAELAAVAGTAPAVQAEQGRVTGGAPVTAIQQWFFDQQFTEPHHFNQAVLLDINEALDPDILRTAVDALLDQHDALRLRFVERDGGWQQEDTAPSSSTVSCIDLSQLADVVKQRTALEAELARIQSSLTLNAGPQIRVALFDLGEHRHRLLLVIHHLVVDGVSWRILLEDLQAAYARASRGEAVQLPPKTTSYAVWARRCREHAASDAVRGELPYWLSQARSTVGRLPIDEPRGANTVGSTRSVTVALNAAETEALLRQVPDVYRTQINDVLLTAVADAFAAWTEERRLLIDLEGHGREELFADVDVSRTVGWFTAMYPVALECEPGSDPGASLKSIKEQLRRVPKRGIGYGLLRYLGGDAEGQLARLPQAEVTFNYLGQVDQALPESSRFTWAVESPGPAQSLGATRSHLLDVSGLISDGCLRLSLKYSEHLHRRETIERLAGGVVESLRSLIRHCQSAEAGGYTPSDFPMAELDQRSLDRLVGADRGIDDVYPLSPMQQGLLFHTLLDAASGVYVEQFCCRVHGKLDLSRFQSAWQRTVDRYPALRTSFRHEGLRQPLQIVHRQVAIEWVQQDWRELSHEEQGKELDAFLHEDRQRGFNLSSPPLMRLAVLTIAADSFQIVWTFHHLLLDGWSVPIVLNEVLAAYESLGGTGRVQPVSSRPYRDFISWHRRQDLEEASQFWRRALKGFEAPTPLTVDSPHSQQAGEASPHEEHGIELSKASTDALRSFGRQHQLTLNTLVQAAWALLLSRYSGRDDVLFGATVSGRPSSLSGVESMVGLFINTVPVRVRVRRSEPLVNWLQTVQGEQLEARDYEYCPLSKVQGWSELPAGTPLFESLVVFENYPVDETLLKSQQDLRVDRSRTIERTNYPLTLVAAPGQQFSLRLNYDATRFDSATVARMLGHLAALLEGMTGDVHRRIDEITMSTGAERRHLLVNWNDTQASHAGPRCVHQMFEEQVGKTPDAVALVFKDRAVTYAGLDRWANRLANRLTALGVKPNALVGLFMERGPEMVAGILGVLKAGGAYVPLPRDYPRQRLQFMLEDSGASVILTQEHLRAELAAGTATVECVDGADAGFSQTLRDDGRPPNRRTNVTGDDLAYVMYTSGSTGQPKGTMIEHRSVANYLTWCTRTYPLAEGCGAPVQSSIGFDATITSLIAPLLTGRRVLLLPETQEVEALGAALASDSDFGLVKLTPAHLKMLGPMVPPDRAPGGTRAFVIGGEALTANDVAFWRTHAPRTKLVNEYGPTETVVGCCVYEVSAATTTSGAVPIGRPIDNTQLYVLDRGMDPTPVSVPGEIYIGGAGLGRGYLNRPELTAEKFVPNPFSGEPGARLYRTGDLGRHCLDGELEYHGRTDDQVKLRGFRIELGEIEAVLSRHPQVREAVVMAREDGSRGKRLVAYVTSADASGVSVLELRSHLQGALPAYMVPAAFVMLDALPLTANGKVDRRALPAPDATRQELQVPFVAATTDAEQKIAAIWKDAIGVDSIGLDDNFFEVGGDSLIMIEVQWKLKDVFGRNVPLAQMFQHPTVRSLAAALSRRSPEEAEAASNTSRSRAQTRLEAVKQREQRRGTRHS
jgi:amino acid adenylation domain-containing protein/non-ribosomal peptide synthase protein (TIGR01720 family)